MKLIINIPKEFEEHFNKDKFSDSLARVASDIENFGVPLSGRYEQKTITMLRKAFEDATPLETQPTDEDCISRSELLRQQHIIYDDDGEGYRAVYVKDIKAMPPVTPRTNLAETSQDCISREDVDAYIAKLMSGYLYDEERTRLEEFSAYLWDLPPVTPERPKGKWITQAYSMRITCTNCEKEIWYSGRNDYKYCPSCGAEMEGGEDGDSN